MTIDKTTIAIITCLFGGWFFIDSYFAHAVDVKAMQVDNQVNNWSLEQSLNYMQQKQIKSEIRKELKEPEPNVLEIDDLRETYRTLKARGTFLQNMQDKASLEKIKHKNDEKSNPVTNIIKDLM